MEITPKDIRRTWRALRWTLLRNDWQQRSQINAAVMRPLTSFDPYDETCWNEPSEHIRFTHREGVDCKRNRPLCPGLTAYRCNCPAVEEIVGKTNKHEIVVYRREFPR